MRDYALTCAAMNDQIGTSLFGLIRNLWRRAHLAGAAPDNCTIAGINWARSLPLDTDPQAALEDRLLRRPRQLANN